MHLAVSQGLCPKTITPKEVNHRPHVSTSSEFVSGVQDAIAVLGSMSRTLERTVANLSESAAPSIKDTLTTSTLRLINVAHQCGTVAYQGDVSTEIFIGSVQMSDFRQACYQAVKVIRQFERNPGFLLNKIIRRDMLRKAYAPIVRFIRSSGVSKEQVRVLLQVGHYDSIAHRLEGAGREQLFAFDRTLEISRKDLQEPQNGFLRAHSPSVWHQLLEESGSHLFSVELVDAPHYTSTIAGYALLQCDYDKFRPEVQKAVSQVRDRLMVGGQSTEEVFLLQHAAWLDMVGIGRYARKLPDLPERSSAYLFRAVIEGAKSLGITDILCTCRQGPQANTAIKTLHAVGFVDTGVKINLVGLGSTPYAVLHLSLFHRGLAKRHGETSAKRATFRVFSA